MERKEIQEKAKHSIDELFAKIDELEVKKNEAKDDVKATYAKQLEQLKTEKSNLEEKYNNLVTVGDDKLEEAKAAFSKASDSFKQGFGEISSLFKKQS